jgi:hypothetical protein
MTQGCLIFAYDGQIDYGSQAILAARLVKKHLGIPVCLVSDSKTVNALKISPETVFEYVVIQDVKSNNTRLLYNGPDKKQSIDFKNINRNSAYDLTPWDRTLLIDSDFLVFSDRLKQYLNSNQDFMICPAMKDICAERTKGPVLLHSSSIQTLWATNIIFNKTPEVKMLFDLIEHIKDNWEYYGALYKFDTRRFRNDFAFSVACHIMGGYGLDKFYTELPAPIWATDQDKLVKVGNDGNLVFLIPHLEGRVIRSKGQDIHFMNKYDMLDNIEQLSELAK